jgi:hypothetical protein
MKDLVTKGRVYRGVRPIRMMFKKERARSGYSGAARWWFQCERCEYVASAQPNNFLADATATLCPNCRTSPGRPVRPPRFIPNDMVHLVPERWRPAPTPAAMPQTRPVPVAAPAPAPSKIDGLADLHAEAERMARENVLKRLAQKKEADMLAELGIA